MIQATLEEIDIAAAPKEATSILRARRTLAQLRADGITIDLLESDALGPTRFRRRSMEDSTWRRVAGDGRKADSVFEIERGVGHE